MTLAVHSEDDERLAQELRRRRETRQLYNNYLRLYTPAEFDQLLKVKDPVINGVYPWQAKFHNAGKTYPERLMMAANRVGKTRSASAEVAMHMTGQYPPWWRGRRWNRPTRWWTGAERTEDSRDLIQLALLGPEGEHGTGWIPEASIAKITYRQAGVSSVVDQIFVLHKSGGISQATLKTYQMEVKGWRGASLDGIWLDEEPNQDIFTECQTRVLDRRGMIFMTFTPMEGPTEVVVHFLENQGEKAGIYVQNVTWDEAPHLDPDERERLWNSYPPHEREARAKGNPMLGSGAVFPISDDAITVEPFEIPKHWSRINGIDFGIDHPGAGVACAIDRDTETFYVYDVYKKSGETPIYHVAAMKKHGVWIPCAWPHDGLQRDKSSGKPLRDMYRDHGLYMLKEHAHYPDERQNSREASVIEMLEWMRTNRFKVFSTCGEWFAEKRLYHRKEGQIVAKNDDIISATRMAFIMRRYARLAPSAAPVRKGPTKPILGGRRWKLPS